MAHKGRKPTFQTILIEPRAKPVTLETLATNAAGWARSAALRSAVV